MTANARSVDDYLAQLPLPTRRVVSQLRRLIKETAPGVTERVSYGLATFHLNGQYLVYVAGWKQHVSLYPVTAGIVRGMNSQLKPYMSGKATLRFPLDQPLPKDLIRRLVRIRVAERRRTRST